jgi:hypothetical protein
VTPANPLGVPFPTTLFLLLAWIVALNFIKNFMPLPTARKYRFYQLTPTDDVQLAMKIDPLSLRPTRRAALFWDDFLVQ